MGGIECVMDPVVLSLLIWQDHLVLNPFIIWFHMSLFYPERERWDISMRNEVRWGRMLWNGQVVFIWSDLCERNECIILIGFPVVSPFLPVTAQSSPAWHCWPWLISRKTPCCLSQQWECSEFPYQKISTIVWKHWKPKGTFLRFTTRNLCLQLGLNLIQGSPWWVNVGVNAW